MNRLNNKVAVFIGGGSSVGSVACKTFLEEGANVVLVDIDEKYFERTAELRNQYGEDRVVTFIGRLHGTGGHGRSYKVCGESLRRRGYPFKPGWLSRSRLGGRYPAGAVGPGDGCDLYRGIPGRPGCNALY